MKKTLLLAGMILFAGTAYGQSINYAGNMNGTGSLGGAASINAGSVTAVNHSSSPAGLSDFQVNQQSKNPGEYVPSTFSDYREAVALGVLEAHTKPMTIVEAARLAQAEKKNVSQAPVIVVEQNSKGKLVMEPAAKQ
jgi:hypothetical protein